MQPFHPVTAAELIWFSTHKWRFHLTKNKCISRTRVTPYYKTFKRQYSTDFYTTLHYCPWPLRTKEWLFDYEPYFCWRYVRFRQSSSWTVFLTAYFEIGYITYMIINVSDHIMWVIHFRTVEGTTSQIMNVNKTATICFGEILGFPLWFHPPLVKMRFIFTDELMVNRKSIKLTISYTYSGKQITLFTDRFNSDRTQEK